MGDYNRINSYLQLTSHEMSPQYWIFFVLLFQCYQSSLRVSRSIQMKGMVLTGSCNFGQTLKLMRHGIWCGPYNTGSNNEEPVDKFDFCCKDHDNCWGKVGSNTPAWAAMNYRWTGSVLERSLKCEDDNNTLHGRTCLCDMEFSYCIDKVCSSS